MHLLPAGIPVDSLGMVMEPTKVCSALATVVVTMKMTQISICRPMPGDLRIEFPRHWAYQKTRPTPLQVQQEVVLEVNHRELQRQLAPSNSLFQIFRKILQQRSNRLMMGS
jgi:hypothetical protein